MSQEARRLLRNFIIEMLVYGVLLVIYFLIVLSAIGDWLTSLYDNDLVVYAILALVLIVAQGVVLEWVTTFLVERLGLERLE